MSPKVPQYIQEIQEQLKQLSKLSDIEERLNDLAKINDDVQQIKAQQATQAEMLSAITDRVSALENELQEKNQRVAKLEVEAEQHAEQHAKQQGGTKEATAKLETLAKQVHLQEQESKRENLVVTGLKFIEPFNPGVAADVQEANIDGDGDDSNSICLRDKEIMVTDIVKIFKSKLNVTIVPSDIQNIYAMKTREPKADPAKPRGDATNATNANADATPTAHRKTQPSTNILVRFASRNARDRVFYAKRALKGTNIFISEQLTSRNAFLYKEARAARTADRIKQTWTTNGNVIVKDNQGTIHRVRSVAELESYCN